MLLAAVSFYTFTNAKDIFEKVPKPAGKYMFWRVGQKPAPSSWSFDTFRNAKELFKIAKSAAGGMFLEGL